MPQLQALNLSDLSWQLGSLSESVVQSFTPAQISNLGTLALQNLFLQNSDCGSQYLTTSQLQALGGAQIQELGGLVYYLTDKQVASLTPAQFAALSPQQISEMQVAQIAAVTPQQWAAATDAQIGALSAAQIGAIAVGALGGLSGAQMDAISASSVAGFTSAQLYALTGGQVSSLSDAALGGLSAEQVGSLNVSDIASMSEAQFDEIAGDVADGTPTPTPTSGGAATANGNATISGVQVVSNSNGTFTLTGTLNVLTPGVYIVNGAGWDIDPGVSVSISGVSGSAFVVNASAAGGYQFSLALTGTPSLFADTTDFDIYVADNTTTNAADGEFVDLQVAGIQGWPGGPYLAAPSTPSPTPTATLVGDDGDSISGYWNANGVFVQTSSIALGTASTNYSFYDDGSLSELDILNTDGTFSNTYYNPDGTISATDVLSENGIETITDYDANGNIVAQEVEQNTGATNTTGTATSANNPGGKPL
jgi:outer membrane lipoprotein SlyB